MAIYRKGVFIVAYKKQNKKIYYLLLKRKLHWKGWEFPKGGIEKSESEKTAVKRELKEETNQVSNKIKPFEVSGKYKYAEEYSDRKGMIGQSYKLFSAEIKDDKISIDKREHSDFQWLDFEKAWSRLNWPNQRKCLMIVNKYLTSRK
jgi:8-oxo-dGTP pyrophosphatase MutT (NUDIX family)